MNKINGPDLKDVSSSYTKNDGVLFSINLSFKAGSNEKVLIKGNNGSGKSTLLNIISSNMEYNSGSILFNGEELNSEDVFSWHILDNFSSSTKIKTIINLLKKTYPKNKYSQSLYKRFININKNKRLNQISTLERLRFALIFSWFMDFKILLISYSTLKENKARRKYHIYPLKLDILEDIKYKVYPIGVLILYLLLMSTLKLTTLLYIFIGLGIIVLSIVFIPLFIFIYSKK